MTKEIINARVITNREIAKGIFLMEIRGAESAIECAGPGQFVNVYPKAKQTLLPRPISICRVEADILTLVYGVVGEGTKEFSGYPAGDLIRISTPLGTGYNLKEIIGSDEEAENNKVNSSLKKAVLVGGGIGVPPLVGLAEKLITRGVSCTAVLGFRDEPFLAEAFESLGVETHITTDSGRSGYKGTVLDLIREKNLSADYFYACGPKIMLRALNQYCLEIDAPLQVSMEERMGCGYGACVGCVCKVQSVYKKVCQDGPVFYGRDVDWND